MDALPVGSGFYNWRDFSGDNIAYIKRRMMHPFDYAEAHLDEIDWNELWGEEPTDENMRNNVIASRLKTASKLIPLFKHRYVPAIGSEKAVVLSIHGVDAICYGYGLRDYFYREFISNSRPVNISNIPHIPFWDEIM